MAFLFPNPFSSFDFKQRNHASIKTNKNPYKTKTKNENKECEPILDEF